MHRRARMRILLADGWKSDLKMSSHNFKAAARLEERATWYQVPRTRACTGGLHCGLYLYLFASMLRFESWVLNVVDGRAIELKDLIAKSLKGSCHRAPIREKPCLEAEAITGIGFTILTSALLNKFVAEFTLIGILIFEFQRTPFQTTFY